MPTKIIIDGAIVEDTWSMIPSDATQVDDGQVIVPLLLWNEHKDELTSREQTPGLLLEEDQHPEEFLGDISKLPVVVINFPSFTDGRGFSLANILRERYQYKGQIRARGDLIRDQLTYLTRCGFNAFDFNNKQNLTEALDSLDDFSDFYQSTANQADPLFRRRSA